MLNRQQKESEIERMRQEFSQAASIVFAQHSGLTVTQAQELRARLRQAGAQARVAKNTLIAIALGSEVADALGDILTGPTTYAWHPEDPATPAKVLQKFAEEHPKLLLKGGVLENQALDLAGVERLAKMPSRNELFAQLLGVMLAPGNKLASVLSGMGTKVAGTIKAYEEKLAKDAA